MPDELRISLLGGFRAAVGGGTVSHDAWRRGSATALVKILALAPGHRLHREQLTEALWPLANAEAAASGLRKALHFARHALTADHVRVRDDLVALEADAIWTDVEAFEVAAAAGDVAAALSLYQGDLLPEDRFEPWAEAPRERLRRRFADLLLDSARGLESRGNQRAAVATLARLLDVDPLSEEASAALIRLHAASGQRHLALLVYRRIEDRLREELGVAPGEELVRLHDDVVIGRLAAVPPASVAQPGTARQPITVAPSAGSMPEVRYARSGEVSIAYQVLGGGPVDLVHVMGWVTHIAYMWEEPSWRRFFERLASFSRLILFDKRGTGLSDRVPVEQLPSLETRMSDVQAVMDAAGSRTAAVFGVSEGGPMSALFAATFPERTSALVMYGTYAKRIWAPEYPWAPTPAERRRWYELIESDWGGEVDAATMAPTAAVDPRFRTWWARYCQMSASPAAAMALARMNTQVDVRAVLPSITVPTLILHRTDDRDVDAGGARWMARRIPDARYVELPGEDHLPFAGDQDAILGEIEGFLAEVGRRERRPSTVAALERERKLVTVVTAVLRAPDLPDADPERASDDDEERCVRAVRILEAWGASVLRLPGRSVVAVFGSPTAREDDATRAVRAGLALVEAVAGSVGVESGEVVIDSAQETPTGGEPYDVARHLSELGEPGSVLTGARAWRAARHAFEFEQVGVRGVAGREELAAHRVVRRAPAQAPIARTPMIGRDAELTAVVALVADAVEQGRPRMLSVVGPAGVGKSRLVREAVAAIAHTHDGCGVLRGRCVSTADGVTDWALGEVVRVGCGVPFGETAEVARSRLRAGVISLLRGATLTEVDAMTYALATTAGISLADNPLDRLAPSVVADALGDAWPRFFSAVAAHRPTVVVVEDLHWAGERLVAMLERIVARATGPLALLVTARPELLDDHPGFGASSDSVSTIRLSPLGDAASRRLLDALSATTSLDEARRAEVLAISEGNPYFLEELVAHVAQHTSDVLPDTLRALLAARIDALPTREKRVLQDASVIGRSFWEEPLSRCSEHDIHAAIAGLERRGLVLARDASSIAGQPELVFKHALLRDVAYASLPLTRRARVHAVVAGWLESLEGDRDALLELIAHHYAAAATESAAGDADSRERLRAKAFTHLLAAGTSAQHRYAMKTALALHERALHVAATQAEQLDALEAIGDDHVCAYRGDDAEHRFREAIELTRADAELAGARARLCGKLALAMGDIPGAFAANPDAVSAEALIAEGLAAAEGEVDRARLLLATGAAARLYRGSEPFGQGATRDPLNVDERIDAATEALRVGERRADANLVATALAVLGILYGISGRYAPMIDLVERELAARLEAPSRQLQADALRKRADLAIEMEARFEAGVELARRSYELVRDEPNPHQLMHSTYCLIAGLFRLGRWDEMRDVLDEHVAAFRQDPAVHCRSVADGLVIGAVALALQGHPDAAAGMAALAGDPRASLDTASAWQARFALIRGDARLAVAISEGKALEQGTFSPQHAAVLLDALVELEDWDGVRAMLPIARRDVAGNALLAPTADRAEAQALAAGGDAPSAQRLLGRALSAFGEHHDVLEGARTLALLASVEPDAERERSLRSQAEAILAGLGLTGAAIRTGSPRSRPQPSAGGGTSPPGCG